jgi:hypothetical protein
VRGNGAYAVSTVRSPEPDTLQTWAQFLAAWDRNGRAPTTQWWFWTNLSCAQPKIALKKMLRLGARRIRWRRLRQYWCKMSGINDLSMSRSLPPR